MQLNDILLRNNYKLGDTVKLSVFANKDYGPLMTSHEVVCYPIYLDHGKPGGYVRDTNLGGIEYSVLVSANDLIPFSFDLEDTNVGNLLGCWSVTNQGPSAILFKPLTFYKVVNNA